MSDSASDCRITWFAGYPPWDAPLPPPSPPVARYYPATLATTPNCSEAPPMEATLFDYQPEPALIWRQHVVMKITGLSATTLWRYERAGKFPQRVRLGPNAVGWRSDEVRAWLAALPAATQP